MWVGVTFMENFVCSVFTSMFLLSIIEKHEDLCELYAKYVEMLRTMGFLQWQRHMLCCTDFEKFIHLLGILTQVKLSLLPH